MIIWFFNATVFLTIFDHALVISGHVDDYWKPFHRILRIRISDTRNSVTTIWWCFSVMLIWQFFFRKIVTSFFIELFPVVNDRFRSKFLYRWNPHEQEIRMVGASPPKKFSRIRLDDPLSGVTERRTLTSKIAFLNT